MPPRPTALTYNGFFFAASLAFPSPSLLVRRANERGFPAGHLRARRLGQRRRQFRRSSPGEPPLFLEFRTILLGGLAFLSFSASRGASNLFFRAAAAAVVDEDARRRSLLFDWAVASS
ncbi:hypothetical protein MRX96_055902 [Rhipicephalus microplus]